MNSFYSKKIKSRTIKYYVVLFLWLLSCVLLAYFYMLRLREINELRKENEKYHLLLEDCWNAYIKRLEELIKEYQKNKVLFTTYIKDPDVDIYSLIVAMKVLENKDISLTSEMIHALLKTESDYNPNAISSKGAIGWMQLIEPTAKTEFLKARLPYSKELLSNPKINLMMGINHIIWLRKELLKKGKTDWEFVWYAYFNGLDSVFRADDKEIFQHFYVGRVGYNLFSLEGVPFK